MIHRLRVSVFTRGLITSLFVVVVGGTWLARISLADGPGPGQTRAEYDTRVRENKARARELMSQGAHRHIEAARRWAATVREARRRGLPAPTPGAKQRPAPFNEDADAGRSQPVGIARPPRLGASGATTIPTNVRVNNPAGDAANTTQAEQAIAAWGNYVLVAWNDGLGPQYQGYGYSTDGGQTFTDGGVPRFLPGWTWASDPVVTVNEKSGKFYYCGLVDLDTPAPANSNGIGVVSATFSGSGPPTWDTPVLVRYVTNGTATLDKQWLVADSTTGNLYLTYSTFDAGGDHIDFQRSTNGGTTWFPAVQISAASDNGAVQGSRPVVGLGSDVYATWSAIGSAEQDFIRLRKSTNRGASWPTTDVTPVAVYLNFGTGAPGFNRERGVDFPSIAVDRTNGVDRGHVYLTWTESISKYNDMLNALGTQVETENNDFFNRANPFTPGQRLRGSFGTTTDFDYFSFSAVQGTNYLFECDSVPNPLYTFRVFCGQDTNSRLAFAGDVTSPAGGRGYIIWTAPTTGTYYLRMAYVPGGATGGYKISTGIAAVGGGRARDSRDVFVSASGDGGNNWTTPIRVNDAAAYYDEYLPEVTVGADGMPYVSWFDWRDDGCGGRSYQYVARSATGGASWVNQRFSDVQNDWTSISLNSNLAPDQGDYSHMYGDPRYVRVAWADGRGGSPDVFTTRIDTWPQISPCQADLADSAGHTINTSWTVTNLSPLFSNSFDYSLTSQRNWPLPAPGSIALAAEGSGPVNLSVAIPDTAAAGINRICLVATGSQGAASRSCCFNLTVQSSFVPPPPPPTYAFDLGAGVPNPATDLTTFDFSLPQAGPVHLRIFGPGGELVRKLDRDGIAGPNPPVTWDGRDDHGRLVAAGAYFCKLEAFGQKRSRRLVWLR